jgi:putative hydroxymethylpyrimidine transport system permease protein
MKKHFITIITAVLVLVAWQIVAMAVNMTHILPSPASTVARLWELRDSLFTVHLPATLNTIVIGMLLSVAVGLVLAILMDMFPAVEAMLYPTLVVIQTIPVMCISPLFVLWFGYSIWARLLAVVLSTFFSITINTFDGLKSAKREMKELMTTYGAGRLRIFALLKVPTALPNFMTALKTTLPWAVIGAAIAEWLGASEGLGYFSKRMMTKMDGSAVFAAVLILTLVALIGMSVVKLIDRRFVTWRSEL